jgi:hypothetical protein
MGIRFCHVRTFEFISWRRWDVADRDEKSDIVHDYQGLNLIPL